MTSVTTETSRGRRGHRAEGSGYGLTIIAVDVVALYGLCAYGSRENLAA